MQKNFIPNANTFDADRIYTFDDINVVSKFIQPLCNRDINKNHVKTLAKKDFKCFAPVQVNINNLHCFDGNHRIEAFKAKVANGEKPTLKVICYNMTEKEENNELRLCNNGGQKKWMGKDLTKHIVTLGNEDMLKLLNFAKCHKITCDASGNPKEKYAMACVFGKRVDSVVKNGGMVKISQPMLEYGAKIARECEVMMNTHCPNASAGWVEGMIGAWHNKRKDNTFNEKLERVGLGTFLHDYTTSAFTGAGGKKQWMARFEEALEQALKEKNM